MRFSTLLPLLLAAGVAHAQFGQQGQNGGNNGGNNGQNGGQGQNNQDQNNQGQNNQDQNNQGQNNQDQNNQDQNNGGNNNNGGNGGDALALDPNNVQTNSQSDGLEEAEPGQAASATDDANFINFCTGKELTNGLQVQGGSCNGIPMGDIPAANQMVSAIMVNPTDGEDLQANQPIDFQVQIANLEAGSFTNPDITYYAAPQAIGQSGSIVGHTHITVQDLSATNGDGTLNAQDFVFFKGINDDGNGNGLLTAALDGGLDAGSYRVCSMTSASNHQPVLMPVAQRGAQDDCIRFTVGQGGGNGGNNNQNQNGQDQNGQDQNGQGQNGQDQNGQGQGQDAQQGQDGQDAQQGQNGQDAAQGQDGQDAAQGQDGQDAAQGQDGQDAAQGQDGQDAAQGQDGQDAAQGQDGQDAAQGQDGQDAAQGQDGQDAQQGGGQDAQQGGQAGQGQGGFGGFGGFGGQGGQGGGRRGRGRGRGRPRFAAREFVA